SFQFFVINTRQVLCWRPLSFHTFFFSFLHRFCLFMFVAVRGPLCFLNSFSELLSPIVTTACNFVLSIFVLRPPQYLSHQAVFVGTGTTVIGVSGQKGTF